MWSFYSERTADGREGMTRTSSEQCRESRTMSRVFCSWTSCISFLNNLSSLHLVVLWMITVTIRRLYSIIIAIGFIDSLNDNDLLIKEHIVLGNNAVSFVTDGCQIKRDLTKYNSKSTYNEQEIEK